MRKAFFVIVGISLLISGILLALGKVENDYICKPCIAGGACPPNPGPVGTRQPNYDGKRFGLNGWRCHTQQIKGDDGKTHKIELWCLDRIKDTDKQGNIVAGGDEYLVWICDGKPVGKCPSDGGENRGGKKSWGTWWKHWESDDPSDKGEWDPEVWDDWVYYYSFKKDCLVVYHTSDGKKDKVVHKCTPPDHPDKLPPVLSNNERETHSNFRYVEADLNPPTVNIIIPQEGFLYILGREVALLGIQNLTIVIGPITVVAEAFDGEPLAVSNESGIYEVDFIIDGILKNTTDMQFEWILDEPLLFKHAINIVARDFERNEAIANMDLWIFNF